jgi:hypothetical protein
MDLAMSRDTGQDDGADVPPNEALSERDNVAVFSKRPRF